MIDNGDSLSALGREHSRKCNWLCRRGSSSADTFLLPDGFESSACGSDTPPLHSWCSPSPAPARRPGAAAQERDPRSNGPSPRSTLCRSGAIEAFCFVPEQVRISVQRTTFCTQTTELLLHKEIDNNYPEHGLRAECVFPTFQKGECGCITILVLPSGLGAITDNLYKNINGE